MVFPNWSCLLFPDLHRVSDSPRPRRGEAGLWPRPEAGRCWPRVMHQSLSVMTGMRGQQHVCHVSWHLSRWWCGWCLPVQCSDVDKSSIFQWARVIPPHSLELLTKYPRFQKQILPNAAIISPIRTWLSMCRHTENGRAKRSHYKLYCY